jgi:hypothetical protein
MANAGPGEHNAAGGPLTAGSSAASVGTDVACPSWAVVPVDQGHDALLKSFEDVCRRFGGPKQFLTESLPTQEDRIRYARNLVDVVYPMRDDLSYSIAESLQLASMDSVTSVPPLLVHPAALGWTSECSTKLAPDTMVCVKLAAEMLKDGFMTSMDPLLCMQPRGLATGTDAGSVHPGWANQMRPETPLALLSLGHIKGAARSATFHMLTLLCVQDEVDIKSSFPKLWETGRAVNVHVMQVASITEHALMNAKLSVRGAIRRAPNIISWVGTLRVLQSNGLADWKSVLSQWNAMSTKEHRVVGHKATGVQNVLSFPPDAVDLLLVMVSKFGWEGSPFSDESLASKKLAVGFSPRVSNKAWQARMQITPASVMVCLQHLDASWMRKMPALRRKIDKSALEELAQLAAFLTNTCADILTVAPVSKDRLQELYIQPWIAGDSNIDIEIRSHVAEKSDRFALKDVSVLRDILENHTNHANASMTHTSFKNLDVEAAGLEKSSMELVLTQVAFDAKVYRNWSTKVRDREAAMYHQLLDWRNSRATKAKHVALDWVNSHVHLMCPQSAETLLADFIGFRGSCAKTIGSNIDDMVLLAVLCRNVQPHSIVCSLNPVERDCAANMLSYVLPSAPAWPVAACFCPTAC